MHYLYVGYYVDDKTFTEILNHKINNMSIARQKFEHSIIRSLHEQLGEDVSFVSYVPTNGILTIPSLSYVEGSVITHIAIQKNSVSSVYKAYKTFKRYLKDLGEAKLKGLRVLMYSVIPPFEQAILLLKKRYDIKLITICSEVPELRRYKNSLAFRIKKKVLTLFNEKFDGYVLFSGAMKEIVNVKSKPYLVMEGIAPEKMHVPLAGKKNIVMYAGGLAHDNNIPLLIECCQQIDVLEEVWICGVGPDENRIKEIASKDARIKYFGLVHNEKVLEMESQAKVLVNFRNPNAKLTRYSFPSKILEYIASGSLVISTKLVGIPEEYFDYIIPINGINNETIKNTIADVLQISEEEYFAKCKLAIDFIRNKKNRTFQTKKILGFINNIR